MKIKIKIDLSVPAGICGKNPRKLAQEIAAENNKNAAKSAELARNSRNYWQKIADLGQITKFVVFFFFFLLGTQPYKETCGDKHKTRHRGCRDDVPMYREQLDRPGVSALALQPGIEKKGGGAWSGSKNNNLVRERGASIAPNNNYEYV